MQQLAIIANKNVSLLGNNLRAPIPLIIETPDIHHWQLDPVLKRPNVVLMVLKCEDARPSIASGSDPSKLVEISKTQAFLWFKGTKCEDDKQPASIA